MPKSWRCKKQTSVSHSSTKAERISLDAGLRMDGITALDLWNLDMEVLHHSQNQSSKTKDSCAHRVMSSTRKKNQTKVPTTHDNSELFHIDSVHSNVKFSQSIAMLYVFEDNEAVINKIIDGRGPAMRHVSRTHSVALDWLIDRINLDPKVLIKYVDTKHHLAGMLTRTQHT